MNDAEWLESVKKGIVQNTNTPATKEVKSEPFINRLTKEKIFQEYAKNAETLGKLEKVMVLFMFVMIVF